jgi:hypothetical protein
VDTNVQASAGQKPDGLQKLRIIMAPVDESQRPVMNRLQSQFHPDMIFFSRIPGQQVRDIRTH